MLNPQEQFQEFIHKSREILIILPPDFQGDLWGAGLGLYDILAKLGKNPTLVFSGDISPKFSFLEAPASFRKEISGARDFVLSFNTSRNKIGNVRWEKEDETLNIFVTPERGSINPQDFSFILAKFKFDLVIVIGSPDLETLGDLYLKNTDLFFEVPVINIDNKSENDNFGKINIVDITASTCSEMVFNLLIPEYREQLDKSIAEKFLTGIIAGTDRFQKKNTSPKTFFSASELMNMGADQQEIIRWLYKTQPLPLLKLWGRTMAKINFDSQLRLAWTEIEIQDFVESRSNPDILPAILEKLQENFAEGKLFMLVWNDTPSSSVALLKVPPEIEKLLSQNIMFSKKDSCLEIRLDIPNPRQAGQALQEKLRSLI